MYHIYQTNKQTNCTIETRSKTTQTQAKAKTKTKGKEIFYTRLKPLTIYNNEKTKPHAFQSCIHIQYKYVTKQK